jgi:hypothetical protein
MATNKSTSSRSVIATLLQMRKAVTGKAEKDNRDLTPEEEDHYKALNTVIAYSPATNARDAKIKAGVAFQIVDLLAHGDDDPNAISVARAAFC